MMKNAIVLLFAAAVLAGCLSSGSPYDYIENWLVREDAVRPFVVPADVIFVQDPLYVDVNALPVMLSRARDMVGRGRFHGVARVFSPLVANEDDVKKAVDWYIGHHGGRGRPFVFVGEGAGGALLKSYEEKNRDWLDRNGLAASYYSEAANVDFVTDDMVLDIRNVAAALRYRQQWGRDMPVGMLER